MNLQKSIALLWTFLSLFSLLLLVSCIGKYGLEESYKEFQKAGDPAQKIRNQAAAENLESYLNRISTYGEMVAPQDAHYLLRCIFNGTTRQLTFQEKRADAGEVCPKSASDGKGIIRLLDAYGAYLTHDAYFSKALQTRLEASSVSASASPDFYYMVVLDKNYEPYQTPISYLLDEAIFKIMFAVVKHIGTFYLITLAAWWLLIVTKFRSAKHVVAVGLLYTYLLPYAPFELFIIIKWMLQHLPNKFVTALYVLHAIWALLTISYMVKKQVFVRKNLVLYVLKWIFTICYLILFSMGLVYFLSYAMVGGG